MTYPVVSEHVLGTVGGKWLRRQRRKDMPPLLPGTVYVLRVGGAYRPWPEGLVFDPGHDDVLDASSVSVIDTRARVVEIRRTLPSVSEADRFTVCVSFSCQVTDPGLVARHGVVDVTVPLGAYLAAEDELPRTTAGFRIEEINVVREAAAHRMTAYTMVNPPRVAGMTVEFVGTGVQVADDLRDWEQTLREQRREQELLQGQQDFESRRTQQMADMLALGPLYAEVLHMVRDGADMGAVVARMNATAAQEQSRHAKSEDDSTAHTRFMQAEEFRLRRDVLMGLLARLDSDGDVVFGEELLRVLTHQMAPADGAATALNSAPSKSVGPAPSGRVSGGGFVRDEDDLVE